MTAGGVNFPGLFDAWGRQVIAGIGWELVTKCVAECGGTLPDFTDSAKFWTHQVRIDRPVYTSLCDQAVVDSGAELLFHTMVAAVARDDDGWRVTLCTKTGLQDVTVRVLIDCTGDATAVALAGYELAIPSETQPGTLICHGSGYDVQTLDLDAINRAYEEEVRLGRLSYTDCSWNRTKADVGSWLKKAGENANHIHDINARDSQSKSRLEIEARRSFLRLYRFLRTQPGLEHLRIDYLAPECGVRETATIIGKKTITVDDYTSGRLWDDAVCYSFYPIDLHTSHGGGINGRNLERGVVPTIPRGAMLPAGSRNLLVAGRSICSDRLANSALRVQATSMAVGQAAGAMAALATRTNTEVESLPMDAIRQLLREHGAIVPE